MLTFKWHRADFLLFRERYALPLKDKVFHCTSCITRNKRTHSSAAYTKEALRSLPPLLEDHNTLR